MNDDQAKYVRCRNCGKYIEENQSISKIYCSEKCAEAFTRCPNCGKVFPSINKNLYNGFCSAECDSFYDENGILISEEKNKSNDHGSKGEN